MWNKKYENYLSKNVYLKWGIGLAVYKIRLVVLGLTIKNLCKLVDKEVVKVIYILFNSEIPVCYELGVLYILCCIWVSTLQVLVIFARLGVTESLKQFIYLTKCYIWSFKAPYQFSFFHWFNLVTITEEFLHKIDRHQISFSWNMKYLKKI